MTPPHRLLSIGHKVQQNMCKLVKIINHLCMKHESSESIYQNVILLHISIFFEQIYFITQLRKKHNPVLVYNSSQQERSLAV